jgi:hypothetical protein
VPSLRRFAAPSPADYMYSLLDANTAWHRFTLLLNLSIQGLSLAHDSGTGRLPPDFEETYVRHRLATIESVMEDFASGNFTYTTLTIIRGVSLCEVGCWSVKIHRRPALCTVD